MIRLFPWLEGNHTTKEILTRYIKQGLLEFKSVSALAKGKLMFSTNYDSNPARIPMVIEGMHLVSIHTKWQYQKMTFSL